MLRAYVIIAIIIGSTGLLLAQKSKVISVFQLIETDKYTEAKEAIEEAIEDERTWRWPKTWYARGLLCQTAYEKGLKEDDKKKYSLYPDQLYVAFESYEKAITLDKRGRLNTLIAPQLVLLSNDFQNLGEKKYKNYDHLEAFRAFEHALIISRNPILSVEIDTNLVYNTALAAYKSKEWDKAIGYLSGLNNSGYSVNTLLLLHTALLEKGDTASGIEVLQDGIIRYDHDEHLVLLLVDLLLQRDSLLQVVALLDNAIQNDSLNYTFHYTKGLVYQKKEQYEQAISAYMIALDLTSEKSAIYENIGMCYYNIGVELEEEARIISNQRAFLEEKEKSKAAFMNAVAWMGRSIKDQPDNQKLIELLHQLHEFLQIPE